nr:DUF3418 domain-containing protein [Solemya velesiana gill symbiont]
MAGHLVKRSYSEPHWEKNRGQVAAYEKQILFGLAIVPRRKVNYGPINPEESREIFIRFALVEQDFHTRAPFWRHNRELIEYIEDLEHKSRRRDLLVDEQAIYEFYNKRIPEGIYSTPQFEQWLRKATAKQSKLLHMRQEDLMRREELVSDEQFPGTLDVNGMQLPLVYHSDPGHKADGVTLKIPQTILNQISEERCEWLVPGLLRERVVALLRSLPKNLRKSFVPIPDYADKCIKAMGPSDVPLIRVLSEQLKAMNGVHVPEDAWQEDAVPDHLRMNFHVLDEKGKRIAADRDLAALKRKHGGKGGESYHKLPDSGLEREGIIDWDFGPLPESIEMKRSSIKLRGFPALVDRGDSVAIRVLDSEQNARRAMHEGLRRLFMLKLSADMRYLRRNLPGLERMRLQYAKVATAPQGTWRQRQAGPGAGIGGPGG